MESSEFDELVADVKAGRVRATVDVLAHASASGRSSAATDNARVRALASDRRRDRMVTVYEKDAPEDVEVDDPNAPKRRDEITRDQAQRLVTAGAAWLGPEGTDP